MDDWRRGSWAAFGGAVFLTTFAIAGGWYFTARNGIAVKDHQLVPASVHWYDPFLLVCYLGMFVGLVIVVLALSGGPLPGVTGNEKRRAAFGRCLGMLCEQSTITTMARHALTGQLGIVSSALTADQFDQWEEEAFVFLRESVGIGEAVMFRSESGLEHKVNSPDYFVPLQYRHQRLTNLAMRAALLPIARSFNGKDWETRLSKFSRRVVHSEGNDDAPTA